MKLSDKDKEYIIKQAKYWQQVIGIVGWKIFIRFGKTDNDSRANISFKSDNRIAVILFDEDFDDVWDKVELNQTVFHEISEIKYRDIAQIVSQNLADEIIHKYIRQDENTWFKYMTE